MRKAETVEKDCDSVTAALTGENQSSRGVL